MSCVDNHDTFVPGIGGVWFRASMRLAYQDMTMEMKKQEERIKSANPQKAEQMERLGMGFGGRR